MSERKLKQLYKLLDEFRNVRNKEGENFLSEGERQVTHCVRQWVAWHADEEDIEL